MNKKPVIIVAPLNWGLGHATRCISIINELLQQNATVLLAGDGRSLELLRHEYPQLTALQLPPYDIVYPNTGQNMAIIMAKQIPKILWQIAQEHRAVKKIAEVYKADALISDNRYGCYLPNKPSVFVTHQIFIQTPSYLQFAAPLLLQLNKMFIHRFAACWIPDLPDVQHNLSGNLAHLKHLDVPFYRFIGTLSRMNRKLPDADMQPDNGYKAAIILSGPEPQRTLFEEQVIQQTSGYKERLALVRGITESNNNWQLGNLNIFDHLTTQQLNRLMLQAGVIIARSGYSTIMDLAALGKKAALVPTPGQTEQEYLASRFMQQGVYYAVSQPEFNLQEAINQAMQYKGMAVPEQQNRLKNVVKELIAAIT